jgi:polysaccharide pyruvyl transferase WcaK-like protein
MTKQILHAHNYGHQNIGDDAMAENVYTKLTAIENAKVTTISTYSPPHQSGSDISSLSGMVNNYNYFILKIFLVGVHRLKLTGVYLAYSWFTCEFCLFIAKIYKATDLMFLPIGSMKELILRISSADVYVRSGSGSLNDIWFWRSMYPQFTEARLCNLFGVKVYFTGQGLGPFNGAYREKVLKNFLACCEMITLRDCKRSEELVAKITPNSRNYETVGDDAFDYPKELLDDNTQSLFDMETKC